MTVSEIIGSVCRIKLMLQRHSSASAEHQLIFERLHDRGVFLIISFAMH